METFEESNKNNQVKIYYDAGRFKRNTFEQNINAVNKLYLGLGLKIRDIPYIYVNETDNNIYLSANNFIIEKNNKKFEINYPTSFIYKIFYYDNLLFYLEENNQLNVYKFDRKNWSIKHCLIQQKKNKENEKKKDSKKKQTDKNIEIREDKNNKKEESTPKIRDLKIKEDKVKKILEKLDNIKNNNCKEDYEILCDIIGNWLNIKLDQKYPKEIKEVLTFEIKDDKSQSIELTCTIKLIKYQIDSTGMIREKLKVGKGKITFEDGIEFISKYAKFKGMLSFENSFKCPILFKNFEEEEVPPNKVIMCEIKSGFDLEELKRQLIERINAIKYFKFKKDENPLYYIGIVNFDSTNIKKITKYSDFTFNIDENILIVAAIDYLYFGIDLSYEINDGYLLLKAIGNLNNRFENLNDRIDNLEKKMDNRIDNLEKKMDTNFQNLINELKMMNPNYKFSYVSHSEKNISSEEKKAND